MGNPALNLTHEVSYTTISNSNSAHPPTSNTSTHEKLLRVHGIHTDPWGIRGFMELRGSGKGQQEKQGRQDGSLATHFITLTISTWDCISPSQSSPGGGRLDISQSAGKIWKLVRVSFFPHLNMITEPFRKNADYRTGNMVLSKTTVNNLMHFFPVFPP